MDTGAYLGKKGWIQDHIWGEITDQGFEKHKNVKKMYFAQTLTSWNKYMFNGKVFKLSL